MTSVARKLFLLLLALLMISTSFSACQSPDEDPEETEDTTAALNQDALGSVLPETDYNTYEFMILTHDEQGYYAEEYLGEPINDAVFQRNTYLEDKYNIAIATQTTTAKGYLAKVEAVSMADMKDQYDLLTPGVAYASQLATKDYLLEFGEIPVIDLEQSYWWKYVLQDTSIAGENYFAINDCNLKSFTEMSVIMFNKQLASDKFDESFYQLVKDGEWTMETYLKYSKDAYSDATGNGVSLDDTFGTTGNSYMTDCFIYGWDMRYIEKNDEDMPYLNIMENHVFLEAFEDVTALFHEESTLYGEFQTGTNARQTVPQTTFQEGRCLFWVESLGWASTMRSSEMEYGLLPMPKLNRRQTEYTNCIHAWNSTSVCVMRASSDLTRTGTVLEDMALSSQHYVRPAYYDIVLEGRVLRDEESFDMLPYILNNVHVDLAMVFRESGFTFVDDLRTIATKKYNATTRMERYINAYKTVLDRLVNEE